VVGVLLDIGAYHLAKWVGSYIFALLVPYTGDIYDNTVYAALVLLALSLNFGSQTELVERVAKLKLAQPMEHKVHSTSRVALWVQTINLAALLMIAAMLPEPLHFVMFVVCTAASLALGGFQSLAERWIDESERRPLFKANWQLIFLPSAMLSFMWFGDTVIDPDDVISFDPLTSLSFVFAPVVFALAFHRMRAQP
jgi:hypothetical protein